MFADPDNAAGRALLAKTYDQLGYRAEAGPWRDVYLSAAQELRHGGLQKGTDLSDAIDLLRQIPLPRFFDSMAARIDGPRADGKNLTVNVVFTDRDESYVLELKNAVLHHERAAPGANADVTIRLTHEFFLNMLVGQVGLRDVVFSDDLDVDGSRVDLLSFLRLLDRPDGRFNIVTP